MSDYFKDDIIYKIADKACNKITKRVIRYLQSIKDVNLSSSEVLENAWDEICVQVQDEYSVYWDAYLFEIEKSVVSELKCVDGEIKLAIWLNTDEGISWNEDAEENDEIPYFDDDIVQYIVDNYILGNASNYFNKRIEKYLWN